MIKNNKITILIIGLLAFLVVGYITFDVINDSEDAEAHVTVTRNLDIYSSTRLNDIVSESNIIVKGKYSELIGTENMLRNPVNLKEEDPDFYAEGRTYQFNIDEVIHGVVVEDSIQVIMHYSDNVDVEVEESGISEVIEVINPLFVEPDFDKEYVLFLSFSNDLNAFYGSIEPYAVSIDDGLVENISPLFKEPDNITQRLQTDSGDIIEVYTPFSNLEEDPFSDMTIDQLIDEINKLKK